MDTCAYDRHMAFASIAHTAPYLIEAAFSKQNYESSGLDAQCYNPHLKAVILVPK